jgi:hypothetical protein
MALVRLFGIGEVLSCRVKSQPWPRCKVLVLDGGKPSGFGGESCGCVMVPNQLRLSFQFVNVVDCLVGWGSIRKKLCWGTIDNDGVGVVVLNHINQRNLVDVEDQVAEPT